jgi:hypothetical protein
MRQATQEDALGGEVHRPQLHVRLQEELLPGQGHLEGLGQGLVVVVGIMAYQVACALNARKADVRATACRVGLLLLDDWKSEVGDVILYDPQAELFDVPTPAIPFDQFTRIDPPPADPPGSASTFRYYMAAINGCHYFVKLSYYDEPNPTRPDPLRLLNVRVGWSRGDFQAGTLGSPYESVSFSKYAYY